MAKPNNTNIDQRPIYFLASEPRIINCRQQKIKDPNLKIQDNRLKKYLIWKLFCSTLYHSMSKCCMFRSFTYGTTNNNKEIQNKYYNHYLFKSYRVYNLTWLYLCKIEQENWAILTPWMDALCYYCLVVDQGHNSSKLKTLYCPPYIMAHIYEDPENHIVLTWGWFFSLAR